MIGADQSPPQTELAPGSLELKVRFDPDPIRTLIEQIDGPTKHQVSTIAGVLFGNFQNGLIRVHSLRSFPSTLARALSCDTTTKVREFQDEIAKLGQQPSLQHLQLVGWYGFRPEAQVGLCVEATEFDRTCFSRGTHIALTLARSGREGYDAELYTPSSSDPFSLERFNSFHLPSEGSRIAEPLEFLMQSSPSNFDESFFLRSYEITRPLKWRDSLQNWIARAFAGINLSRLRVQLQRQVRPASKQTLLGDDPAVPSRPFVLQARPSFDDSVSSASRIEEQIPRSSKATTDEGLTADMINIPQSSAVEDFPAPQQSDPITFVAAKDATAAKIRAGEQQAVTSPLLKPPDQASFEKPLPSEPVWSIYESPIFVIRATPPVTRN